MNTNFETIIYEVDPPLARVTLNRPAKLNAFDNTLFRELFEAVILAGKDRDVRAIFVKGAGRSFSSGEDLSGENSDEVVPPSPATKPYQRDIFAGEQLRRDRWQRIFGSYKPLVAQVHGYCLGCACELILMCHTTVVAEDAVFGTPAVRTGYVSPNPLWMYKLGIRKAQDVLFTGRYFDGTEAQRMGLATIAVPREKLHEEGLKAALFVARQAGLGGGDGNVIGIGGIHPNWSAPVFRRVALDANGFSTAWGFSSGVAALSAIQRYGFRQDEFNFWEVCRDRGYKAAIREREERIQPFFPSPKPNEQNV